MIIDFNQFKAEEGVYVHQQMRAEFLDETNSWETPYECIECRGRQIDWKECLC